MAARNLPDLTPQQVSHLQDALLSNADTLLQSAVALLDLGAVALARSLAILGLEESGKAIAVHRRRIEVVDAPPGEPFRCEWLDDLWRSHQKKLELVHEFLLEEEYWFGTQPPDRDVNAAYLGAIRGWSRRHDRSKQRGFYVDLGKNGQVLAPDDVRDEEALREVISHVHQVGWQLRLGEHIEGKRQDKQEAGVAAVDAEMLESMAVLLDDVVGIDLEQMLQGLKEGHPGRPLNNAAYRFNTPGVVEPPLSNLGRPGYEAETREILALEERLDRRDAARLAEDDAPESQP